MDTNTQKQTGLNAITSTLNRGSTGDQVKALQQYLIGLGYNNVKADGVYGPVTEAAVSQFQLDNGLTSDGHFGPQTLGKAKAVGSTSSTSGVPGTGKLPDDPSNMYRTDNGAYNTKFVPKTQAELDASYNAAVVTHPVFAGNSADALTYAASTGDYSNLMNSDGKPFSQADQEAALAEANNALAPGFDATKSYETANTEDLLKAKNADYSNFLNTEKNNFQKDKTNLDQNATDSGVLFSGGRAQKEQSLKSSYDAADAAKLASASADIAGTARDYQYKYGNDAAASPTLSQYYQLAGGNNYNTKVATGGVTHGGLSSIYNTGQYNFQGTSVNANKASAASRAAALLANKGNKLLSTGYQNLL